MDTITGIEMCAAMHAHGGLGCLHRYASPDEITSWISHLRHLRVPACVSVGIGPENISLASRYAAAGASYIIIDIAHGHSILMKETLSAINLLPNRADFFLIAGNVATPEGTTDLAHWGADAIKCGIANGAVCDTKATTGHGYPQLSTILDCTKGLLSLTNWEQDLDTTHPRPYLIADGGLRSSGDIVKALAAGADLVMIGGLLAGTDETPKVHGEHIYRGMASADAQLDHHHRINNLAPEGISKHIPARGPAKETLDVLLGGIRSGLSYSGASNIRQLQQNANFHLVTPNFYKR